jgi:putative transposase
VGGQQGGQHPPARGKLGATRSVLSEGDGVPIGRAVAGAQRHDVKMVRESIPVKRPAPSPATPHGRCLEKGDDADAGRDLRAEFGFPVPIRGRGEEAKARKQDIGFRARRGVVERTPRGMKRCRRVRLRWDKNVRHDLGFLHVAWAYITSRQAGLLG